MRITDSDLVALIKHRADKIEMPTVAETSVLRLETILKRVENKVLSLKEATDEMLKRIADRKEEINDKEP